MVLLLVVVSGSAENRDKGVLSSDTLSFWKCFSFHTNLIDWVTATPNVTVEWDVTGSPYNRVSILGTYKNNWNTSHSLNPRIVYNYMDVSLEGRYYWHTHFGNSDVKLRYDTTRTGLGRLFDRFGERMRVVSGRRSFLGVGPVKGGGWAAQERLTPRYWRAYYIGGYFAYDKYTLLLGRKGIQGRGVSVGVSLGFARQLYPLKRGSIDLEIGGRLGVYLAEFDKFKYDEESACYGYTGSKVLHVAPFPAIQDVHVSLIYRFVSAKDKYQWDKARAKARDDKRQDELSKRMNRLDSLRLKNDSIQQSKLSKRKERRMNDSLADLRKQFKKDSIRMERQKADSIADLRKEKRADSLRNERLVADSIAMEHKVKEKASKRGRKKKSKEEKDSVQNTDTVTVAFYWECEDRSRRPENERLAVDTGQQMCLYCDLWCDEWYKMYGMVSFRQKGGATV